ncbi:unnamed protein product, partial [marine sediment metagenome]
PYNWESLMDKYEQDDGLKCTLVTIQGIDACSDYYNSDSLFNDTEAHIRAMISLITVQLKERTTGLVLSLVHMDSIQVGSGSTTGLKHGIMRIMATSITSL